MKTSATHLRISVSGGIAALTLIAATPLAAQPEDDKPVTDETVTAEDVATTPIRDLNLKKDDIPQLLIEAQAEPYSTKGLRRCSDYARAVGNLDALLGPDFDTADPEERKLTVGGVAQSVVGSLIPFRGVIREVSGARRQEEKFQDAIVAGLMRRSFLKGMGLKLGCEYPARPADEETRERVVYERYWEERRREEAKQAEKD